MCTVINNNANIFSVPLNPYLNKTASFLIIVFKLNSIVS